MTTTVEADGTNRERKFTKEKIWNKAKPALTFGILVGAIGLWGWTVYEADQNARDAVETNHEHEKSVAISLARAGFTNLIKVEASDGIAVATLSENPDDPRACSISFVAVTQENGQVELTLEQKDAAGKAFSSAILTSGQDAPELIQDLCS